jgi:uncharacterized protein YqgQ
MMNKEKFTKRLNLLKDLNEETYKLANLFKNVTNKVECLQGEITSMISEEMKDTEDWVNWWLYEEVEKVVKVNGEKIELKTIEKLYDFLRGDENVK